MGFGDSIICTSIVKKAKLKYPERPIVVGDGTQIHWCEVFDNNPKISREIAPGCLWVHNSPGRRPYIKRIHDWGYEFNEEYRAEPGELFLDSYENGPEKPFVYIEPNVKGSNTVNKDYGFENWQRVVDALPEVRFIQGRGRRLEGVEQFPTESFIHACRLLLHADFFVGVDGGLAHAAAALGKRAVVVWSGFVNPKILGYSTHINLCKAQTFCGRFAKCEHCAKAMQSITVEMVIDGVERALRRPG